jgi:hypothetical protein
MTWLEGYDMADLQELILRGRFLMANAPERLRTFEFVNGKRNSDDISVAAKRHRNNVHRDLSKLEAAGLIRQRENKNGPIKKDGLPIFEKIPLASTIPIRYFTTPTRLPKETTLKQIEKSTPHARQARFRPLRFPSEQELLEIARKGEDQIYEFKGQGTDTRRIVRELAAMMNTRQGGIVFYGIDDDGNIEGSDVSMQKLDQPLQNSIRNAISPSATVALCSIQVLGNAIIAVRANPWNRRDVYQFDEKVLIRKGTNVFAAKPDELKKLHSGTSII